MKKYEKPVVVINEELTEGVYAASGCWGVTVEFAQRVESDGYTNFRVIANHNSTLHISLASRIVIPFNGPVTSAKFESFEASVSGNVVTLTRKNHANAEGSPDNFNSLLVVYGPETLAPINEGIMVECTKTESVNGKMD